MNPKGARKQHKAAEDHDNPEWTKADFARAKGPESLPADILAAFPKTGRGPQKAPTKKLVSVRLSPQVIEYFKAAGEKGWQARMDAALVQLASSKPADRATASTMVIESFEVRPEQPANGVPYAGDIRRQVKPKVSKR